MPSSSRSAGVVPAPLNARPCADLDSPSLPRAAAGGAAETAIDSARLLQGRQELLIRHGDECYRLRRTRNDKLILTK
jgi:hemin uptake protein HemP